MTFDDEYNEYNEYNEYIGFIFPTNGYSILTNIFIFENELN